MLAPPLQCKPGILARLREDMRSMAVSSISGRHRSASVLVCFPCASAGSGLPSSEPRVLCGC